jgi:hypothetical protein
VLATSQRGSGDLRTVEHSGPHRLICQPATGPENTHEVHAQLRAVGTAVQVDARHTH